MSDGGKRARSPGRSRISRKTIAQGRPDDPPVPVVLPRAFLLHADRGCGGHPAFPAPSYFGGTVFLAQSERVALRECEAASRALTRDTPQPSCPASGGASSI